MSNFFMREMSNGLFIFSRHHVQQVLKNYLQPWCLKFLHRQNHFLTPSLRRLLHNALIQPLCDYGCIALISESFKETKIQVMQNKCIRFCLQLDKRICVKEFLKLNWHNVHDRYLQLNIVSDIFKFYILQ